MLPGLEVWVAVEELAQKGRIPLLSNSEHAGGERRQIDQFTKILLIVAKEEISGLLMADDIQFGIRIACEAMVVIQMLWIQVGQHGHMRRAGGEFQLMGGHFYHSCHRFRSLDILKNRHANVTDQAALYSSSL